MESMHLPANNQKANKPLFSKMKEPAVPKETCALCGATENLNPFKNRHICRNCIAMTKGFHDWNRQYD